MVFNDSLKPGVNQIWLIQSYKIYHPAPFSSLLKYSFSDFIFWEWNWEGKMQKSRNPKKQK